MRTGEGGGAAVVPAQSRGGVATAAAIGAALGILTVLRPELALVGVGVLILAAAALDDLVWLVVAALWIAMVGEPWELAYASLSVGGIDLYPNDLLLAALAAVLVLSALRSGRVPGRPRDPASLLVVAFLAYGVFSLVRSIAIHGSAAIPSFRVQFLYGALYFAVYAVLERPRSRRRLLAGVLGAAAVVGLLGIANAVAGRPVGSVTGSHTHRYLSGLQALTTFFGLALSIGCVWARRHSAWAAALSFLFLAGILVSQARSVWLGAGAALAVVVIASGGGWKRKASRAAALLAVLVALIGAGFLAGGGLDVAGDIVTRAGSLTNVSEDVTALWRLFVWGVALQELAGSPVLGLGLGHRFVYFDVVQNAWESNRQLHNSYLELAYYSGAIAVGLLIAFQVVVLWRTLRAARRHAGTPREGVLLSLAACQVGLAAVAFTNVVGASMVATTYVWILSAASMREVREAGG